VTTTSNLPLDYTLIAGILGEYLEQHPGQAVTIKAAIWRIAFDVHYARKATYDQFVDVVDQASDGAFMRDSMTDRLSQGS
jgi:hypothetical protein